MFRDNAKLHISMYQIYMSSVNRKLRISMYEIYTSSDNTKLRISIYKMYMSHDNTKLRVSIYQIYMSSGNTKLRTSTSLNSLFHLIWHNFSHPASVKLTRANRYWLSVKAVFQTVQELTEFSHESFFSFSKLRSKMNGKLESNESNGRIEQLSSSALARKYDRCHPAIHSSPIQYVTSAQFSYVTSAQVLGTIFFHYYFSARLLNSWGH